MMEYLTYRHSQKGGEMDWIMYIQQIIDWIMEYEREII